MGSQAVNRCPLCTRITTIHPAAIARLLLVQCRHCSAFVIDTQLAEVIGNARKRQLGSVLVHLPRLSEATRSAGDQGRIVTLTSTNWIGIAESAGRVRARAFREGSPEWGVRRTA